MIRGLYTAAAGMLVTQTEGDIVADNMANVRTPGYKEEAGSEAAFPTLLIERVTGRGGQAPETVPIGAMGTGVIVDRTNKTNIQGALETTGQATDLALSDPGYFVVQTPNGVRYTRDGQFQLSAGGTLQTADGYPVLGQNGAIGPLSQHFTVDADGTVVDNGRVVDRLQVVDIPANALQREGQSLYSTAQAPQAAATVQVHQGYIESSNVDVASQMVHMISVMRSYEANQKVIQTEDATLDKAVNEVGKV